jgi:hypothetical protein
MKKKATELKTIKVTPQTIEDLNWLAAMTVKNQYEVTEKLARDRRESMESAIRNAKKKSK